MSEKYEAEKARSLNFQRLLAQEEKRSSELDSEVKRTKRELGEYEARNRELGAQVEAVRQQAAQIQEEAQAMKEATLLEKRAHEDMKRLTTIPSKGEKGAQAAKKDFSSAVDEALKTDVSSESKMESTKEALAWSRLLWMLSAPIPRPRPPIPIRCGQATRSIVSVRNTMSGSTSYASGIT